MSQSFIPRWRNHCLVRKKIILPYVIFFVFLQIEITAADSIAGRTLRGPAGGKSGQREPPYFLTGRQLGGKGPADSKCHRKKNRLRVRVQARSKSPRQAAVMPPDGKPYGLKDQIYRHLRAGSPVVGG